jgi:hypothetical protein
MSIAVVLTQSVIGRKFTDLYVARMFITVFTKADEKIVS